jgi:hypothetical protein
MSGSIDSTASSRRRRVFRDTTHRKAFDGLCENGERGRRVARSQSMRHGWHIDCMLRLETHDVTDETNRGCSWPYLWWMLLYLTTLNKNTSYVFSYNISFKKHCLVYPIHNSINSKSMESTHTKKRHMKKFNCRLFAVWWERLSSKQ